MRVGRVRFAMPARDKEESLPVEADVYLAQTRNTRPRSAVSD